MTHTSTTPYSTQINITVRPISSLKERRTFVHFPWRIYKDDPLWVPPVLSERKARIDPARNPLFQIGEVALFIAWEDKMPVGTIAMAIDPFANTQRPEQVAVFGFFECVQRYDVAVALLDRAVAWGRKRKMDVLRGPYSFGPSDEPGILIEGRETPLGLLMGWSPPYYQDFVERYGLEKFQDSLAYRVYFADYTDAAGEFVLPRKIARVVDYVHRRYGEQVHIRLGNLDRWDKEMAVALDIYNHSLGTLPDYTPMTAKDWQRMGQVIRPLIDKDLAMFIEFEGKPIAFALGLVDINMALLHCNGLRFPWNYAQLWWHSRKLPGASFKIMAMLPEYWGMGLDALIYHRMAEQMFKKGYEWMDLSLTGEDNPMTNKLAQRIGIQVDKRYRVYELELE